MLAAEIRPVPDYGYPLAFYFNRYICRDSNP
jgi:hypothetical protein